MSYDFNYDEALEILKGIAQKDVEGKYQRPIIGFLETNLAFTSKTQKKEI